jgi:hypothetical protein
LTEWVAASGFRRGDGNGEHDWRRFGKREHEREKLLLVGRSFDWPIFFEESES